MVDKMWTNILKRGKGIHIPSIRFLTDEYITSLDSGTRFIIEEVLNYVMDNYPKAATNAKYFTELRYANAWMKQGRGIDNRIKAIVAKILINNDTIKRAKNITKVPELQNLVTYIKK